MLLDRVRGTQNKILFRKVAQIFKLKEVGVAPSFFFMLPRARHGLRSIDRGDGTARRREAWCAWRGALTG